MEYRSDESLDVQQYIKNKTIEIVKVPLGNSSSRLLSFPPSGFIYSLIYFHLYLISFSIGAEIKRCQELFYTLAKMPLDALVNAGVFHSRDPKYVSKGPSTLTISSLFSCSLSFPFLSFLFFCVIFLILGAIHVALKAFQANPPHDIPQNETYNISAKFGVAMVFILFLSISGVNM